MTTPSTGAISMSQIRSELGRSGAISFGDTEVRELAFVPFSGGPATGAVSLSAMHGKERVPTAPGELYQLGVTQWAWSALYGVGVIDNSSVVAANVPGDPSALLFGRVLYCRRTLMVDNGAGVGRTYAFIKFRAN